MIKVKKIDELMLETECNRIVMDFNLSRKEWTNIKTILNGMFEYALRKKYLIDNPIKKIKILVKFKQVDRKTGKTETYNSDELKELNRYLDQMYVETNDTVFLAVKINFLLGLRVGELVTLKWEDYCDINHLHIVREEIRNQITYQYEIVEWYYVKKKYKLNVNFFNNTGYHYTAFNSISFNALQCSLSYSFGDRYPQ